MNKYKSISLIISILLSGLQIISGQSLSNLKIGSAGVPFNCIGNKTDTLVFINLHNNEQTSITAIKQVLQKQSGCFLGIQSGGTREYKLIANGKSIAFDPNRIFTKSGVEKTLKNHQCYSVDNCELVNEFGQALLNYLSGAKLLVAIHNNTGASYSITNIQKTNHKKHDAREIYINPEKDDNDFYFVTEKAKFDYFKSRGYNVLLQDNENVEDDGSLSVYCGKAQIDYINVECENGHLNEQINMIIEIYKGFVKGYK